MAELALSQATSSLLCTVAANAIYDLCYARLLSFGVWRTAPDRVG